MHLAREEKQMQNVSSLAKTGEQQMVTNGAKEEHLTMWRDGAGLAGCQPHASLCLCSAPEKAAHPSTAADLPEQQRLHGLKLSSQVKQIMFQLSPPCGARSGARLIRVYHSYRGSCPVQSPHGTGAEPHSGQPGEMGCAFRTGLALRRSWEAKSVHRSPARS